MVEVDNNVETNNDENMNEHANHQEDVNESDIQIADAEHEYNESNIADEEEHYANVFDCMFNEYILSNFS